MGILYSCNRQVRDYDPEGTFVRLWVPELRGLTAPQVPRSSPAHHEKSSSLFIFVYLDPRSTLI